MKIDNRRPSTWMLRAIAGLLLGANVAGASDAGLVLRAIGWYAGKGDISSDQVKCEVPTITTAIPDGSFAMGIWNTYGVQTLFFPDRNQPFANPCGGWLQLQSSLLYEGLTLDRIKLTMKVHGARRWRTSVPTRNGFPTACRAMRRTPIFAGERLDPPGAPTHSGSGAPNVAFVQALPMVRTELIHCLRSQYNSLPTEVFTDLPLVIEATAYARSDSGSTYRSNPVRYTLNLRHVCGNGRVDDGEFCDPGLNGTTPLCSLGVCKDNECSLAPGVYCPINDAPCDGFCEAAGTPNECTCSLSSVAP